MTNAHFGLRDNPFRLTPELAVRCDWASFAQARERVAAALRAGRKCVLNGEAGVGKTLLLRSLAQEFDGAVYVACAPRFSMLDLAAALDGAEPKILLLDDAHGLESAALSALLGRPGPLALAGPPLFAPPAVERVSLAPMGPTEVAPYVRGRLEAVGWRGGALFEEAAFERLHRFSRGSARRINNLCSAALFLASQRQAPMVSAELVEAAAAGLSLQAPPPASPPPRRPMTASPPPLSPKGSPIIMAAFMRERGGPARPEVPRPAELPTPDPPPLAAPTQPMAPAPPVEPEPEILPPERPAAPAAPSPSVLRAPEIARLVEPEPPPRRRRPLAAFAGLSLGAAALVALGAAWRFELTSPPDLPVDWAAVEAVMSPRPATAEAGFTPVLVAREAPVAFPQGARSAPEQPQVAALGHQAGVDPADASEPIASGEPAESDPPREEPQTATPTVEPEPPAAEAAPSAHASIPPPPTAPEPSPEPAAEPPAAEPAPDHEARIAELLALARRQALAFALTTPQGQSAFDSYAEILAIEPGRPEALAGIDEIAAKYDDLASVARQRDKPSLVQLYETRAAQVRRDRVRFAEGQGAAPQASR